ncbi:MAG: competence/damage-inducible protein A [Clostridiaceae bacterium]|nr:competence/damage-inducible protein A [Clostridiaceae bacterium]
MTAEILAVGTELLMGQIANTNAQYLSRRLAELGINVYFHTVVGDNPARLEETLKRALNRSDIVITTGGLGPTKDDLTKETISKTMNRELVLHEDILDGIRNFFAKRHRKMAEINKKQAYLPENSIVIPNPNGTAPGCIIEEGEKTVIMLPGPPKEMQPMFEATVFKYLKQRTGVILVSKMLKIFGIGESDLETRLMDLIESQNNPTIAPYASQGEITVRVTARCSDHNEASALLDPVVSEIKSRLGVLVYSEDGQSLEEVVFNLLKENGLVMATAESCTGGLLSERITDIPGSSEIFERAYITYANRAKVEDLGVSWDTLNKYGAVSHQTAMEMLNGLKQKTGASVGVAITGIAGPGGGTPEKPVGLVFIAAYVKDRFLCRKFELMGNRERVRNDACLHALDMTRRLILGVEQQ